MIIMRTKKSLYYLEKITNVFEIVIALLLLIVVAINVFEMILGLIGFQTIIFTMDFKEILAIAFNLVIGIEFTKMLCKHTPETVIDVLLFTIARQMVMSHERTIDMLVGVLAIAGLFVARKFLIDMKLDKK